MPRGPTHRPRRTNSRRSVPREPRHPIEVRIVAGELRQRLILHHRDDEGITAEEFMLRTEDRGGCDQPPCDGNDLNTKGSDFVDGLLMAIELSDLRVMSLESRSNARLWPAETRHGFDRHQAVSHIREHMGGSKGRELLASDAIHQRAASGTEIRFRSEVIDQRVSVDE